ncbi:isopentenyl-diphosphate Delta-isomerase [Microbacterium telephonicum]|uniref:Isopentenyl-diphosphate Delta-isomerase n=1 Tax=Microbacterium telephonicum TaxID=1714841 RepID=A0A498C1Y1_9MICO|nr:isopentenyl-diphosphate Delta-isomerase [Microbacterium telephonicum]RLK49117.1 isopentenyl-diphosphate delta-isomerase [Microbacterium telephonicum]
MVDEEQVVLVDEGGTPIGTAAKSAVHTTDTPLHLAFSCHVARPDGRVLVTRRALDKRTWPGVWTNSFCGHPGPGEDLEEALRRRARHELGIEVADIRPILPDFRYRAVDAAGIVENEICPVFAATTTDAPAPRADEIAEYRWVSPVDLAVAARATPWAFSPWLVLQLAALTAEPVAS